MTAAVGYYSEGPLRTTPSGRRALLRVVVRGEEAGPPLEETSPLVARAPMAGARLSTGWQLRHEGVLVAVPGGIEGAAGGGKVGGIGAPRHVGSATFVHRDAEAPIGTRPAKEGGVDKRRARDVELRHKRVNGTVEGSVEGPSGVVGKSGERGNPVT